MSSDLEARVASARAAWLAELPVARTIRQDRLDRAIALLLAGQHDLAAAMDADFGGRPPLLSRLTDILPAVRALRFARAHLKRWMRPERRRVGLPLGLFGARAWVEHQPRGVVGIMSPWNYPVGLAMRPLAGALAAGNRVLVKPAERTPVTAALLAELVAARFDPDEVSVWPGDAGVGAAFAKLPLDHLLFTGGTAIGRSILAAAAPQLTPVTLELGGKSPAVIGRAADLARAAERVVLGKMMNAGQTCLAPDYVLVARAELDAFVEALQVQAARAYPTVAGNSDYAQLIDERAAARIEGLVAGAEASGARCLRLQPHGADRRLPLTLVIDPPADVAVSREELFGPVLPIVPYDHIDEAIASIQRRETPLGLFYFGPDRDERRKVLDRTLSGGVTLDDVFYHVTVEDLPLGGVGASGMGAYQGREGFRTFSHARAVYHQPRWPVARLAGLVPPYGKRLQRIIDAELGGP